MNITKLKQLCNFLNQLHITGKKIRMDLPFSLGETKTSQSNYRVFKKFAIFQSESSIFWKRICLSFFRHPNYSLTNVYQKLSSFHKLQYKKKEKFPTEFIWWYRCWLLFFHNFGRLYCKKLSYQAKLRSL